MTTIKVPITGVDRDYLSQLDYALSFTSSEDFSPTGSFRNRLPSRPT